MDHATQGTPRRDLLKGAAGLAVGAATVGALGGNSVSAAGQTSITLVLDDLAPIELLAYSWGGSSNVNIGSVGSGGGAGKVSLQDLSVTKYVDHASTTLLQRMVDGLHFDRATLTVTPKAGPVSQLELQFLIVTSVSAGGMSSESRQSENVTLAFAALQYTVDGQTATGGSAP